MHSYNIAFNQVNDKLTIYDRLCKNRPCSHLVVIRETLVKIFLLKLTSFACARPLLFSRTGLSNLLNKIQFTFVKLLLA